jgi:glyoxylase-like metal-dependent hydrolase (beta-lactamase superfamily II)
MRLEQAGVDIIVSGYPGKSVCHGGLGWSTIALIRADARIALVDAGPFGMRDLLLRSLAERGLKPADVTDLLLTHSHWDHSVNWTLFPHARIVIGAEELAWSLEQPWGRTPVPELYVRELDRWPTVVRARDGDTVMPGMTAHLAPGHTPGCLVYRLAGRERDVIFTGDAAKNRVELISRSADMTYDPAVTAATIEMIWGLWTRRPGSIVVPGHDLPMVLDGGRPAYLGMRSAAITAWHGDTLDQTTRYELAGV